MQKLLFILLIFVPLSALSQTQRFIYSYKFVPDSTKIDSVIIEKTRLEIFNDHSEFVSDIVAKRDSAVAVAIERNESHKGIEFSDRNFNNKVYKSKALTYTIEYIGIQPFKVVRQINLTWKLLNLTKKILGYNCQKATVNFGNRTWEAWFTSEIPIQEGPYLFGNLPGLIVQINDLKNYYSFSLLEIYKTSNTKTNFVDNPYLKPLKIEESQFKKKWKVFREHPMGATEQITLMNPFLLGGKKVDENGNEIDSNQFFREEQKQVEEKLKRNNNYIDSALYK